MTTTETDLPQHDRIALVMPAHRLGPDLDASVRSVAALDPAPDEFIVVVDGNPAVSAHVGSAHDVVEIAASGPAAARNAGVAATTAEIVLFIDSDVVVPPNLIASVRDAMRSLASTTGTERPVDAIIGSYDADPGAPALVSQFRNLLHHWTHQRAAGVGHTFWGACGAVRRTAFDAVGGFDESYADATIEDIELGERLAAAGFFIQVAPWVQVTHLKCWTLGSMIHTDITKRGVPWSRLILSKGEMANDLNTTTAARVSVAIAGTSTMAMVAALVGRTRVVRRAGLALSAVLAMWLTVRDRQFLSFLRRERSLSFALRSIPLMWVHHLCAAVSFAWAVITWPVVRRRVP